MQRIPPWLKVKLPGSGHYYEVRKKLRQLELHTVCEEARCPNIAECWGGGTATFMILGKVCTRACRFCDVTSGKPVLGPDPHEPGRVADAVRAMALRYAVITSVDRDDLKDGGADHFVAVVSAIRQHCPTTMIELLTPDFAGRSEPIQRVARSGAEVLAQNIETVERLTRHVRDRRCGYTTTLDVLQQYRETGPHYIIKSSILLGLGEREPEVVATMRDLYRAGVDWVTLGQYLRPTRKHAPVQHFVTPVQFERYREAAKEIGFPLVSCGPLVRSSYRAGESDALALYQSRLALSRPATCTTQPTP